MFTPTGDYRLSLAHDDGMTTSYEEMDVDTSITDGSNDGGGSQAGKRKREE